MKDKVAPGFIAALFLCAFGGSIQFFNDSNINAAEAVVESWISDCYAKRNVSLDGGTVTFLYALTTASTLIGSITGALLLPFISEGLGRRNGLVLAGIIGTLGALVAGTSKLTAAPEQLIVGRILLGADVGAVSGLVPMYLTETAPLHIRGSAAAVHQLVVALADTLAMTAGIPELLGNDNLWPVLVSITGLASLILAIFLPFCAESPRYLLCSRKDAEGSARALKFFTTSDNFESAKEMLEIENNGLASQNKLSVRQKIHLMLRNADLKIPLLICVFIMIGQQATGVVAVFNYSTSIFSLTGLSPENARWATVGSAATYFAATIVAVFLIEKVGRRRLLIFQYSGCIICLTFLSIFSALQDTNEVFPYLSIVVIVAYMMIYGVGSPIAWIIASELFNQRFRSTAVSISVAISWFLAAMVSLVYLPYQGAVGTSLSFVPFIVILILVLICILIILPETQGKTIDQIVAEFRHRRRTISVGADKEDDDVRRPLRHKSDGAILYGAVSKST